MLVLMRSTKELILTGTNYDETYVKDLTIGKRAITITADVQSKSLR
jgi:hypothetical protein